MEHEEVQQDEIQVENLQANEDELAEGALELPVEEIDEEISPMSEGEVIALVEAIVFAAEEPITPARISDATGLEKNQVKDALEAIEMKFEHEESGLELCTVGSKYQFRTKGRFGSFIRELKAGRPRRLSGQALETLAIIAYRQPIVKSDIEKIRGVDATPTLKTLVERKLIKIVGHQPSVGQPALYGTTDQFLSLFGMASLGELPSLRDVQELMRDPGEVGEEVHTKADDEAADTSEDLHEEQNLVENA